MNKLTTNKKANNTITDSKINMTLINAARTDLGNAWSGEVTAENNKSSALKGYAASLDNNGLGLVAIVNADRKVPYDTFQKRYGSDIFDEDDWKAARKELATLKKLYLEYYNKGKQTFEAWLQNFRLNLMLTAIKGDSAKKKMPKESRDRYAANKQYKPLEAMHSKGKSKSAGPSDTTKLNNKIKSAKNRLSDIKELFEGIKELEKSETTKEDVQTYLVEIVTQLEDNLIAVTGVE